MHRYAPCHLTHRPCGGGGLCLVFFRAQRTHAARMGTRTPPRAPCCCPATARGGEACAHTLCVPPAPAVALAGIMTSMEANGLAAAPIIVGASDAQQKKCVCASAAALHAHKRHAASRTCLSAFVPRFRSCGCGRCRRGVGLEVLTIRWLVGALQIPGAAYRSPHSSGLLRDGAGGW